MASISLGERIMAETKYAIKLYLALDDWIYVTKNKGYCDWNIEPVLFSKKSSAEEYAKAWKIKGHAGNVKVVEYHN
jgi:hypothetical protein